MIRPVINTLILISVVQFGFSQNLSEVSPKSQREHILMDLGWRFNLGHASDYSKDFYHRISYFTHFAKAGYGDGAAATLFEDRAWREVDLPHDWVSELPFSNQASHSHGYRTVGWRYPETSVGWYRKRFDIPASDFGRKISIQFDGIFRNASVWINGFYLGTEPSGYAGVDYDLTDYLNYGGENVLAVRVDASIEEGWFYEGAGIYRHVWLNKTDRLHVAQHGTFITSEVKGADAVVTIRTSMENQHSETKQFSITHTILDDSMQPVKSVRFDNLTLRGSENRTYYNKVIIEKPDLWSIDNPYLYTVETIVLAGGQVVDTYKTPVGIRTVRFDPNGGFFLNGERVLIKGVNNHQDHAGVGVAIPDALQEFRVRKLKEMGCNAIRTSHNPPTPELLDICDRLGMLILDENRLMGINQEHFDLLKRFMIRDCNHPCVFLWSLGNEEWAIEGNEKGAQITKTMQEYAQTIDSSRAFTVAISGGWDWGSGKTIQVMGYNYIVHGSIDEHHKKFPWQSGIGTEETNTIGTRGIFIDDRANGHMAPIQHFSDSTGTEYGWRYYLARPFLAGLFYWTGFDYHGEPNPIGWPQVNSQFGILDLCGFPKDIFYYLKSWWTNEPVMHIAPHWNNPLGENSNGKKVRVTIYSNAEVVELILNKKSLGKKTMPRNGHLDWEVTYEPGSLMAKGYVKGKLSVSRLLETTGAPAKIDLWSGRTNLISDGSDVAVVTVKVNDSRDRIVQTANNEILFTLSGPGRIIGVGNGDPASHDPEQFIESVTQLYPSNLEYVLTSTLPDEDDFPLKSIESSWMRAFERGYGEYEKEKNIIIRGNFYLNSFDVNTVVTFYAKSLAADQSIFVNGKQIARNIKRDDPNQVFILDHNILEIGKNEVFFTGTPFVKKTLWEEINTNPGTVKVYKPSPSWRCKTFNGIAQVILRTTNQSGEIILSAQSEGLVPFSIKLNSNP